MKTRPERHPAGQKEKKEAAPPPEDKDFGPEQQQGDVSEDGIFWEEIRLPENNDSRAGADAGSGSRRLYNNTDSAELASGIASGILNDVASRLLVSLRPWFHFSVLES